ncbi:Succinate dehydrogenase (Or fumarate reductase) cytochrome b subunit, b558 family [Desulfosarcina cetonica]|uniref:succinate dehydrogenase cytochrome b subunit n=1 Tax=Desulfosarcina cetonica TaxID=90730 RepID=UPI0006D1959F|nr:succinate dehydrogenase cytochrome b subunit [Desulfosarcina cetonica]VTR66158.1 Succinate dehydrogenase (Or fumarate reductase) cytochrome b subunit, b558 family [Desulfosarcina cetonica]
MNWITGTLGSSIGKKLMMAITGFSFCGFLTAHLAGNLTIYGGQDAFNGYAAHLHALGPLVTVAEVGLLTFALIHVITGVILFLGNLKARPVRYAVNKSAGGRTIGSATMPYTGVILLAFIVFHLMNFHFVDKTNTTIFAIVSSAFTSPTYVAIYIVAMVTAAIHVSHGFWSAFQTVGANHPKYMPLIRTLSIVFAVIVGVGFGFLPVYIFLLA